MNHTGATVHITKLAAAQRQLRAAIRFYFAGEDELAIHTVASAAYRLINDLKAARGMSEAADVKKISVFYVVRDFRRGTLPKHFTENVELMKWIIDMAAKLPIGANSTIDEITADIGDDAVRAFWRNRSEASNFLKHADKDSQGLLSAEKVDNYSLLMQAMAAYTDLVKSDLGPEGLVLWLYSSVEQGDVDSLPEKYRPVGHKMLEIFEGERRDFCSALIQEMRAREAS